MNHVLYRRLCEDLLREIDSWPYRRHPEPAAVGRARSQLAHDRIKDENDLIDTVHAMPEAWRSRLRENGIIRISQARKIGVNGLMQIKGIGIKKAQWIISYIKDHQ